MYKILIVFLLFVACKSVHRERKFYVVINTREYPIIDSFHSASYAAAYDSASRIFHTKLLAYQMIIAETGRMPAVTNYPLEFDLRDNLNQPVTDSVPYLVRKQTDSTWSELIHKELTGN